MTISATDLSTAFVSLSASGVGALKKYQSEWERQKKLIQGNSTVLKKWNSVWQGLKAGGGLQKAEGIMATFSQEMISARMKVDELEANIRTLGITQEKVPEMARFGAVIASEMGIAQTAYLEGVNKLKSGIASLSAESIPQFAAVVAKTARATGTDFTQLAQLYSRSYNQFQTMYSNLADTDIAERIGNQIAMASRIFDTHGAKMQTAMNSLGAQAAVMKVKFHEQTAVLGQLQNVMNPGEAGAAYGAFLSQVGKGMQQLGLSATDANGNLKSMPQILSAIGNKFGENIDATAEMPQLISAFGKEGVKTVLNLIPHTSTLKQNIDAMGKAWQSGSTAELDSMFGERMESMSAQTGRLSSGWKAFMGEMGRTPAAGISSLAGWMADLVGWLNRVSAKNPAFASVIGTALQVASTIAQVGDILITARSAWKNYTLLLKESGATSLRATAIKYKQAIASKVGAFGTLLAAKAQWAWNAALAVGIVPLLAIVAAVALVAAGAYLLWKNWDQVSAWLLGAWESLKQKAVQAWGTVKEFLASAWELLKQKAIEWGPVVLAAFLPFIGIPLLIYQHWGKIKEFLVSAWNSITTWAQGAGLGLIRAIISGIKSGAQALYSGVQNLLEGVRKYLPFSDAKLGPLATVTRSGQMFVSTFTDGIQSSEQKLYSGVQKVLGGVRKYLPSSDANPGPLATVTESGRKFVSNFATGIERQSARASSSADSALRRFADPQNLVRNAAETVSPQLTINVENLVGRLFLGGQGQSQGSLQFLAESMAQALSIEIKKHEEFA